LATIVLSKQVLKQPTTVLPAFIAKALLRFVPRRNVSYSEKLAAFFDQSPLWQRYQCYFVSTLKTDGEYKKLFTLALQNGFLLPPTKTGVGLIPNNLRKGELVKLEKTIF
jgi:hypothetical protein